MMDSVFKTLYNMNGKSNLVIDTMDFQVILFKEFTAELKLMVKGDTHKDTMVLYLDDEQYDVPVSSIAGLVTMVGIVKWKSRIWEDDYNQITGNFEMVLANENGPIKYSQPDSPIIYDVSKLASFQKVNENFTQGAYLVCKHKQFNDTTLSWSWSLEGCLINQENNNRVTC